MNVAYHKLAETWWQDPLCSFCCSVVYNFPLFTWCYSKSRVLQKLFTISSLQLSSNSCEKPI